MLKRFAKTLSVLMAAAALVGGATALSGASEKVSVAVPLTTVKADRLDARFTGVDCSQQTWPYYDADCVKDLRQPTSQAKAARIVTVDRLGAVVSR